MRHQPANLAVLLGYGLFRHTGLIRLAGSLFAAPVLLLPTSALNARLHVSRLLPSSPDPVLRELNVILQHFMN